jgi:integrase/recombinase XerD
MAAAATSERDKLAIRVLADTGMRAGELLGLELGDVRTQGRDHYLKVRGKGSRERLVPIPPGLYLRLERYLARSRPKDTRSQKSFLGLRRRPNGDYEPLTPSGLQQMVRIAAAQAGISKRVHPHLLRHSYATWALQRNMNPIVLARILGHSSLEMINAVYSHLSASDTHEAMMRLLSAEQER